MRPTRRRSSTSPHRGLYALPSLCVIQRRLGDPRVVPSFRWSLFIGMSSSATPGCSSAAYAQFLRRRRLDYGLGTSHIPTLRFLWGVIFRGFTTVRSRYDLSICSPPVGADSVFTSPTGTFTAGLSAVWSPAPPPTITTRTTGQPGGSFIRKNTN